MLGARSSSLKTQGSAPTRSRTNPNRVLTYKGSAWWVTNVPSKQQTIYPKSNPESGWTVDSIRSGLLARKMGMGMDWDQFGALRPLTFLRVEDCHVVEVKTPEKHGYTAVKIGAGTRRLRQMSRAQMGICARAQIPPKRWFCEFKVTPDAVLPQGSKVTVMHIQPGQRVDVQGVSKGKGFQGVMKRWGFAGGCASHGNSLAHRTPGSTGQRQDPGKVFKGKKMAGRMGGDKITMKGLRVFAIYPKLNIFSVVGGVPGGVNGLVKVKDTWGYKFRKPPPFPTWDKPIPAEQPAIFGIPDKNTAWEDERIDSARTYTQMIMGQRKLYKDDPEGFKMKLYKMSPSALLTTDDAVIEAGKAHIAATIKRKADLRTERDALQESNKRLYNQTLSRLNSGEIVNLPMTHEEKALRGIYRKRANEHNEYDPMEEDEDESGEKSGMKAKPGAKGAKPGAKGAKPDAKAAASKAPAKAAAPAAKAAPKKGGKK